MPKDKAETTTSTALKTKTKVPSSSKNEEVKKSRESSTDRSNVKKSLTTTNVKNSKPVNILKKADPLSHRKADTLSQRKTDALSQRKADTLGQRKADTLSHRKADNLSQKKADTLNQKKVESSRMKTEVPTKTVTSKVSVSKTVSKTKTNVTPRTSLTKSKVSNVTKNNSTPMKSNPTIVKDAPSKRVTKEQYFPKNKKYPFSSYLHEDILKTEKKVTDAETVKKVENEVLRPKLSRERTMTRTLSPSEVKIIKNIVQDVKTTLERPRTATIRKHYDVNESENESIETHPETNLEQITPQNEDPSGDCGEDPSENFGEDPSENFGEDPGEENDYEDDFDSYESDFEVYSSASSTSSATDIETNGSNTTDTETNNSSDSSSSEEKFAEMVQKRNNSAGNEEERKLDSGIYLSDLKQKQILNKIKEAIEKENSNLSKFGENISNLASLSDEGFEEGSKNSLINTGFINFSEAKKKQKQKKNISKSRKRGDDLMGMIRLNNVSFSLFDMKAISYEEFMQSYGKSGTIQISSQTGDDDIDEEIQTDLIITCNKSTQFPVRFSEFDENPEQLNEQFDNKKLDNFLEQTGKLVLHILEHKQQTLQTITKNDRELPFSEGYFSLSFDTTPFLKNRVITHISHSKHAKLLTIHENNIQVQMDQNLQLLSRSTICIWDINEPDYPTNILANSGEVTKACFDSNHGFLIFAGVSDGSVCLWDLRENSKLHRSIYDETTDKSHILRSPTYTTTITIDSERNSAKIIAIHSFSETNFQHNTSGIQVATLDETGIIVLWSVIQKSATPELLSEDQGLIPWGCVLLVQGLVINLQKLNPTLKELQCFDLQFSETDFNNLYVVSNYGILHCLTSGMKPKPKIYSTDKSTVNCVEMAPFSSTHFLSGCENGNIKLHSRFYEKPLMTLCSTDERKKLEENIQIIEWSNERPCVFFVKDKANCIHIWDLTSSDMFPIYSVPFQEDISDIKFLPNLQTCYLAIASKNFGVRIHTVSKEFAQITPQQYKTELNIFLNYANRL